MSDLNVARLVPHNEQDALLAAACPLPDMVAGVGHVFHRGEYWLLIYESCGHDQYFRRTADGLYDLADVEAEIRQRYATCGLAACDAGVWLLRRGEQGRGDTRAFAPYGKKGAAAE